LAVGFDYRRMFCGHHLCNGPKVALSSNPALFPVSGIDPAGGSSKGKPYE
jgi:hypothetical protein